jgi:hypothetical protein
MAACEHAAPSTTPSIVLPSPDEPTSISTDSAVAPAPAPEADPEYEEVRLMTRAGPKWVKKAKEKPRVTRQPVVAEPEPK